MTIKDGDALLETAIPAVAIVKHARYSSVGAEEIEARIADNLAKHPLAGFVAEGPRPTAR